MLSVHSVVGVVHMCCAAGRTERGRREKDPACVRATALPSSPPRPSNVILMHENRLLCVRTEKRRRRETCRTREKDSDRETLYKNETGRVGRCSCCRRRCHPLTTVLVLHVFERAHCWCCGGGEQGSTQQITRWSWRDVAGGGDYVHCVYVCERALFS